MKIEGVPASKPVPWVGKALFRPTPPSLETELYLPRGDRERIAEFACRLTKMTEKHVSKYPGGPND